MPKERPNECYSSLLGKIDNLELKVRRIKEQLRELKAMVIDREIPTSHTQDEKNNSSQEKNSE